MAQADHYMMSQPATAASVVVRDFDNIWTYDNASDPMGDFINYTDVETHAQNPNDLSLPDFDAQDLGQLNMLDPLMATKYEHDVISPDSGDVIAPDSQMHVTSTAHSPYGDLNQQMSPGSLQAYSSSSPTVPSSTPYTGEYGFEVSVQKQPKDTKSVTWTHSEKLSKLYVRLGAACPFVYRTSHGARLPHGCVVRVLPVYIRPEHVREVVRRCPNHLAAALSESPESKVQAQHLIRSQHALSRYVEDPNTRRLSVVIPYEQAQAGAEWVTTLLEFHCFSSCVGGLNRRPVQVIFTLEDSQGNVLGRRAIEVRVCACPGRDRSADERAVHQGGGRRAPCSGNTAGLKRSAIAALGETEFAAAAPVNDGDATDAKQARDSCDGDVFTLKVRGRQSYNILCALRDCLELSSFLPPQLSAQYRAKQTELHQRLSTFDDIDVPKPVAVLPPAGKTQHRNNNNNTKLVPNTTNGHRIAPVQLPMQPQYHPTVFY